MSDKIEELSKRYKENVESHARSVGLFPIPEYPEFECQRGMLSTAFDVILTTLRYLAPATVLTLFWGQQSFLFKFLKYIDCAFRALVFSSEERKQEILEWLLEAGPVRVDDLDVLWRHGWILCGILDSALPGACAGHAPTRLSLKHAQAIADNYLGVEPVFTRHELELNDSLSRLQEWRLINYLDNIRIALSKLAPSKSNNYQASQKDTSEATQITLNYIARGSGLVAAQVNNKVYFKIYPTAQQSLDPGDINILIHGPKETYGMTVLPPILGKAQLIRQNLLGLQSRSTYTENVLPITHGATYLRSYGKNDMNKTYYIPKTKYDIDIDTEIMPDHAKIGYVATLEGKYEISITSRDQNVVGSPFKVTASKNIVGILERDSFCLEDGEEIDIVDIKTDKKVVLRIVDFVTEKMLLKENGCLEKITEDEAKYLLENDNVKNKNAAYYETDQKQEKSSGLKRKSNSRKFYKTAHNVIAMNRVCKFLLDLQGRKLSNKNMHTINKQLIPDIVNSTFYEENEMNKDYTSSERRDKIIIPENISVSILTEKPQIKSKEINTQIVGANTQNNKISKTYIDDNFNTIVGDPFEDDNISIDTVQSLNNPFFCDINDQTYAFAKKFGSFIPNEYESNNSHNEETENANVKLYEKTQYEIINETTNPFLDIIDIERPKTPVYKIITGAVTGRDDSIYINPQRDLSPERTASNDFLNSMNPFIDQQQEQSSIYKDKPDFIIGAPVSLPPVINIPSSTPSSTTMVKSGSIKNSNQDTEYYEPTISSKERKISNGSNNSNLYSSFDSNLTEDVNITTGSSPTPSNIDHLHPNREISPRKDTWDSAYVSIDDNNCSSDSNVSELSSENVNKRKSQFSSAFLKIGPAEKDLWQNDHDLKSNKNFDDDIKVHKHDIKRHEFTPIVEENEKSVKDASGMKRKINDELTDSVKEAFAELDDIYDEIVTRSEVSSVTTTRENESQNLGIDYTVESNKPHVDSASEYRADVKRQTKILEGKISEIQAKVTESVSASRNLHAQISAYNKEENNNDKKIERHFGDQSYTNIVSEKKKYWDEKIRQIEAKSEEMKTLQYKRRMTLKQLRRNDSLSKRRGKKIVQNFLNISQDDCDKLIKMNLSRSDTYESLNDIEVIESQTIDRNEQDAASQIEATSCFGKTSSKSKEHSLIDTFKQLKVSSDVNMNTDNDEQNTNSNSHLKQELSEKVFQAFETSPKRFFGTSRKHILNKIDTFLGLPDNENDKKKNIEDVTHESGLVSSRISLFHSISQTEELPWARRKCKSMYNITQQDSDKCIYSDSKAAMTKNSVDLKDKEYSKSTNNDNFQEKASTLKEKQAKMTQNIHNRSFDESIYSSSRVSFPKSNNFVKNTIKDLNELYFSRDKPRTPKLKSLSKSEMDIFSKVTTAIVDEDLEKHKSYEELPKINVKNFISLYEDVSKSSKWGSGQSITRSNSIKSSNNLQLSSSIQGTPKKMSTTFNETPTHLTLPSKWNNNEVVSPNRRRKTLSKDKSFEIFSNDSTSSSFDFEVISNLDKDPNYLSLSDIEIEIIEKDPEIPVEPVVEKETAHIEYKNRFTMAKKYFQSLEELREQKKPIKLMKNDVFSSSQSTESLEEKKPRKRNNIKKSRSMSSSEIAKIWNQMQEEKETVSKKLVKISEKFNVDDLFEDVMEGRLSRQGSLRGIPNKKAVLETFRSMENLADSKLNSYEMAVSQLNDFAHENKIKNAQTYLSEYPYLPMTDPSKYHSRLDANATGLITLKELKKIPRRNSVPDLRLNPTFTADL